MQVEEQASHEFYTRPGTMTDAGRHESLLTDLPGDPAALAAVLHGLMVHEHMAESYGVHLSQEDRRTVHVRPTAELLAEIIARDPRPLAAARPPAGRVPGNCRHFTVLMTAMLRAHGTPARARCGFGAYFGTGTFEDHWVCEYWDSGQERWRLIDAQIDGTQLGWFPIDFDLTDVPRDQFIIAGDAWARVRARQADPAKFGLSMAGEAGDWWIAGNLMRDGAALLNTELLPWDCWGAMPGPEDTIDDSLAGLFDELTRATQTPDADLGNLHRLYEDERLHVPATVRNAVLGREETL
ncbi:MAG: transglutaminase-like domain-containing protein [Trebonia sp.]